MLRSRRRRTYTSLSTEARSAKVGTFTVVGVVRDPGSASGSSSTRFGACTADEYREPRALAAAHARQRGADATAVVGAPHGHRSDSDQRHQLASARSIADLPAADCLLGLGRFGRTRARAAVSGVFSVLSCVVEQQAKEIGVRMALGAATKNVVRLILWQSVRPVGIGLAAGGGLAAAVAIVLMTTPIAAEIGDSIDVLDPGAYAASLLVIVASCLLAVSLPALRAARIDPIATLRKD